MTVSTRILWLLIGLAYALCAAAQSNDYLEASKLFKARQFAPALARVESYLRSRPTDAQARFLKGMILSEQNNTLEAIRVFTALTVDRPDLAEPHNNLAVLYAMQGQYDKARVELEIAIRIMPTYATAQQNLGDIYVRLAAQEYQRKVEMDKNSPSAQRKSELIKRLIPDVATSARPAPAPTPVAKAPSAPAAPASIAPPPAKPAAAAAPPAATPPVAVPQGIKLPVVPSAPASAPAAAPATGRITGPAPQIAGAYTVQRGDTLGTIAQGARFEGTPLKQAMEHIYRENTQAFGRSMDELLAGAVLRIPPPEQLAAGGAIDANVKPGQPKTLDPVPQQVAAANSAAAPGAIGNAALRSAAEDKAAAKAPPRDVLKLSVGPVPPNGGVERPQSAAEKAQAVANQPVAVDPARAELDDRIVQLEKTVAEMSRQLELAGQNPGDLADNPAAAAAKTGSASAPRTMNAWEAVLDKAPYLAWLGVLAALAGVLVLWMLRRERRAARDDEFPRFDPTLQPMESKARETARTES